MASSDDILHALGRVEAQVENLTQDVKVTVVKRLDHHSGRIGKLERSHSRIWGAGSLVAAGFAWLGADKIMDILRNI